MTTFLLTALALASDPATSEPRGCHGVSTGRAGWLLREPTAAAAQDDTEAFKHLYEAARAGEDDPRRVARGRLPADARDYQVLLVKGLFGNHMPGYFHPAEKHLRRLGLHVRILKVGTDASVATNAQTVRDAVVRSYARNERPVVLVGHSKGGVDVLAALALYPDIVPSVRGVVVMQSPYGGTPIADDVEACPGMRIATGVVVGGLLLGSPKSVADLTYDRRRDFITAHPLPAGVPVVSLATSRAPAFGQVLQASSTYLEKQYGLASDGLVVPDDGIVPGSRMVRLDDMSHAESVLRDRIKGGNYRPGPVAEAGIELLLTPP